MIPLKFFNIFGGYSWVKFLKIFEVISGAIPGKTHFQFYQIPLQFLEKRKRKNYFMKFSRDSWRNWNILIPLKISRGNSLAFSGGIPGRIQFYQILLLFLKKETKTILYKLLERFLKKLEYDCEVNSGKMTAEISDNGTDGSTWRNPWTIFWWIPEVISEVTLRRTPVDISGEIYRIFLHNFRKD